MRCALIIGLLLTTPWGWAADTVDEGVVKQANVITTKVGKNGKPLVGAIVGVGIGSLIGSGSGKDAAQIVGGVIGAKRASNKRKKVFYGWRYIVELEDELIAVDAWCDAPMQTCSGFKPGTEVYVVDGREVVAKDD